MMPPTRDRLFSVRGGVYDRLEFRDAAPICYRTGPSLRREEPLSYGGLASRANLNSFFDFGWPRGHTHWLDVA